MKHFLLIRKKIIPSITLLAVLSGSLVFSGLHVAGQVSALDTDFSDGITVDSILDTVDADINDSECNDGAGNCTLRAAIEEANNTAGTQTIDFDITGAGVHTIQPASELPVITGVVNINGYTETGATPNSAESPQPFNGSIMIELDGSLAGLTAEGLQFSGVASGSAGSSVRGLAINNFTGDAVSLAAHNITIAGNYIGTDTDGLVDLGNGGAGVNNNGSATDSTGAVVGGLNPEDRNIISGNEDSAGYPVTEWVIQGNYVGLDATGEAELPNATTQASGAFSIDNCSDVLVGGTDPGATNVISGNASHGVAPDEAPGTIIAGNLIGTDWTGQVSIPNESGVTFSGNQTGSILGGTTAAARNIISGNNIAGIIVGATGGPHIEGNYIGLNIGGDTPLPNVTGILAAGSDIVIGGSVAARNVVSGNTNFNVSIQGVTGPSVDNEISYNYIGTDANGAIDTAITNAQDEGIRITADSSGNLIANNRIAGNRDTGVGIRSFSVTQFAATLTPTDNAILENEIYGNVPGGTINDGNGEGIDLYEATVDSLGFPADIVGESYAERGATANDPTDVDAGPNDYINNPEISSVSQDGTTMTVNFDLDAADSPVSDYRLEFFANDTADNGSGKTYLGAITAASGTGQEESVTLSGGVNLEGKYITATTTAVNANTNSGFGSTSEFSGNVLASVISAQTTEDGTTNSDGALAETGNNIISKVFVALGVITSVAAILTGRKRFTKYSL